MFFPEGNIRVHLYGQPVDMRKSFDGLYALTRQQLGKDPLSGELFAFVSKRAIQIKVGLRGFVWVIFGHFRVAGACK